MEFFANRCPYCEGALADVSVDHLEPINMSRAGLHAWGNVIWVCGTCNRAKGARDWREYLRSISTDVVVSRRVERIESYQRTYRYEFASARLVELASALHREIKALIDRRVNEAEPVALDLRPAEPAGDA